MNILNGLDIPRAWGDSNGIPRMFTRGLAGERMRRITRSIGNDLASVVTVSSIEDSSDEDSGWSSPSSSDEDELL